MKLLLFVVFTVSAFAQNVITVTAGGKSTTITQVPVPPVITVTSVTCPVTISTGQTVTCTVTISAPAPPGGFAISPFAATCKQPDTSPCAVQPTLSPSGLSVRPGATTVDFQLSI